MYNMYIYYILYVYYTFANNKFITSIFYNIQCNIIYLIFYVL